MSRFVTDYACKSTFWIPRKNFERIQQLVGKYNLRFIGDPQNYLETMRNYPKERLMIMVGTDDVDALSAFHREMSALLNPEEPAKINRRQLFLAAFKKLFGLS